MLHLSQVTHRAAEHPDPEEISTARPHEHRDIIDIDVDFWLIERSDGSNDASRISVA
jgi:hypothetical protein